MDKKKKEYISTKLKNKINELHDNKCYFCKKDLSKPKKYEKHYHHFWYESKKGDTSDINLVLSCNNCHKKVHSNVKIPYLDLRFKIYEILCESYDIIPCSRLSYSFDDDITFAKDPKNKEDINNIHRIKLILEGVDGVIGKMENDYKKIYDLNLDLYLYLNNKNNSEFKKNNKIDEFKKKIKKIINEDKSIFIKSKKDLIEMIIKEK